MTIPRSVKLYELSDPNKLCVDTNFLYRKVFFCKHADRVLSQLNYFSREIHCYQKLWLPFQI